MVTVKKLIQSKGNKKLGSHRVEVQPNGEYWYCYYATPIAKVDYARKIITVDNGGYKTSSTTRAINSYIREHDGFELIDKRN